MSLRSKNHGHSSRQINEQTQFERETKVFRPRTSSIRALLRLSLLIEPCSQVCKSEKSLSRYTNAWPARVYFNMRARQYVANKRGAYAGTIATPEEPQPLTGKRKRKPSQKARAAREETSPRHHKKIKAKKVHKTFYIGKPPPYMKTMKAVGLRLLSSSPEPQPSPEVIDGDCSDDELDMAPCSETPFSPKTVSVLLIAI